jgi:hypothetical protein
MFCGQLAKTSENKLRRKNRNKKLQDFFFVNHVDFISLKHCNNKAMIMMPVYS